jgi:hypothetical protein
LAYIESMRCDDVISKLKATEPVRAKLTDREGGGQFLYSYFGWHAEIV